MTELNIIGGNPRNLYNCTICGMIYQNNHQCFPKDIIKYQLEKMEIELNNISLTRDSRNRFEERILEIKKAFNQLMDNK